MFDSKGTAEVTLSLPPPRAEVCHIRLVAGSRKSGCCRSLVSAGRWSWCVVPLSGPPVGSGRLGLFLVFFPGPVSSFVSEKRLRFRAPTQEPVFRQVPLFLPRYLLFTWPWDFRFLQVFSYPSLLSFFRLLRQMHFHFRRCGVSRYVFVFPFGHGVIVFICAQS